MESLDVIYRWLDVDKILPYLKAEHMVTSDEYETLTSNAFTPRQKREKLLLLLPRKGGEYFKNFGKCLVWSGQTTLARDIGIDVQSVDPPTFPSPVRSEKLKIHTVKESDNKNSLNSSKKTVGDDKDTRHIDGIKRAMKEKGVLWHKLAHGVLAGPARSGKSSLMKRLTGEMPDSTSPSTGVAEQVIQVGVKHSLDNGLEKSISAEMPITTSSGTCETEQVVHVKLKRSHSIALGVHDSIWFKLLYDDEAIRLLTLASHNFVSQSQTVSHSDAKTLPPSSLVQKPEHTASQPQNVTVSAPQGYIPPVEVFKSATRGKNLERLHLYFEKSWSLYLTDTGGQMEFRELLPVLVSGPSVFFIIFCLHQDLNQRFTIEYQLPDGGRSKPYQSTLTVVEAILQTLASIASMGTFVYKMQNVQQKPKVFIVGTHKDMLDPTTADSEITKIDQRLQMLIKSTSHYQEDLVQYASMTQLIYTVNNLSEDDSDFQMIRSAVENVVCSSNYETSFPSNWLIFSLVLRQEMIKDSTISYEQCFIIAQDCGITDREELDHALWFLHTKVGLIRHFPTPGLDDIVIRHPQILFDMITKLIVNTFTFENVSERRSNEFQQKGVFTLEDFKLVQQKTTPLLPPEKLLHLLEHLRIIAPFKDDGQEKYFLPCALTHSKKAEPQSSPQSSDIPPLLITFKCGYCPKGLPGALIVYLLTNEMQPNFKWELLTDQIFRDQVSFEVSPFDSITLKINPTHLEIVHSCVMMRSASNVSQKVEDICDSVRVLLEKGITDVSRDMNLSQKAAHSLSFFCRSPECSLDVAHPATEISGSFCNLCCKKSGKRLHSPLPEGFIVWFGKAKEGTSELNETVLEQSNEHPALRDAF